MTAKSETVGVVAWIRPDLIAVLDKCRNDTHNGTVDVWMRQVDETYIPLVPESALADARRTAEYWKAEHLAGNEQLATLISGLEALAGEREKLAKQHETSGDLCREPVNSEWHAGMSEGIADCAESIRALIPAAANTESEETNHG